MTESTERTQPLIKCADCLHAKVYREVAPDTGRYLLKVKCVKGHWRVGRKHGACDLHRIMAKRKHGCDDYQTMSDNEEDRLQYLKDLANDLPLERILYEPSGEAVDITELKSWTRAI